MCKMWADGYCHYGSKCHFAHGEEELAESDKIAEMQARLNDNYKTQNCSQFHKEKLCFYGKRCIFRHEHKKFSKIHRHYYLSHLATVRYSHLEAIEQVQNELNESQLSEPNTPTTISETSDEECETCFQDYLPNLV